MSLCPSEYWVTIAGPPAAYLQHLTMYSIYMQLYLLLIGYCFMARRRSAISLSSTSTSCCFSSALLCKALAFVTNDNSPLLSHFSYNSFKVERREETSVFNRLRLPSNSCIASVSFLLFVSFLYLLFFLLLGQVISILSSGTLSHQHHVASNLNISYTINMDDVILYYSPCCQSLFWLVFNDQFLVDRESPFYWGPVSCHSVTKECVKAVIGNRKVFQFTIRTRVDEVIKLLQ